MQTRDNTEQTGAEALQAAAQKTSGTVEARGKKAHSYKPLTNRAAYSPAEFAASCGKHPTWAYRLLYANKLKAVTGLGRILIPESELSRVMAMATAYTPKPRKRGAEKTNGEEMP